MARMVMCRSVLCRSSTRSPEKTISTKIVSTTEEWRTSASPRNTIIGHAIGVLAGYLSLVVTNLTMAGPALLVGVTWPRVAAAGLSLGLTAGLMVLLRVPHPPAGATTLIVSLGILKQPWQLLLLMVAVVLLTLQAIVINRLAGIPYPLWSTSRQSSGGVDINKDKSMGKKISPN